MNPNVRLLAVMEYLMAQDDKPVKQVDIARELNISSATLNRIIKTLSERGYLLRTKEKYCVRNFRLIRNVPMSESYLSTLNTLMHDLTIKHNVSVEAVVVAGFDLLWHSRTELPNATVAIRAKVGFRRNLYELDALARLYLSRLGWEEISYRFHSGGFFETGVNMENLQAEDVRKNIEATSSKLVDYDMDGNHLGVRRFATIIEDENGQFLHLLSMAEAAVPVSDRQAHIEQYESILLEARKMLQECIMNEASTLKYHQPDLSRAG